MNVLTLNCGSSSQSFKVYRTQIDTHEVIGSGKVKNVATKTTVGPFIEWNIEGKSGKQKTEELTHHLAALQIIRVLNENKVSIDAVGHRFVHGGSLFDKTVKIDDATLGKLQKCLQFAPIHNTNSYSVIGVCLKEFPGIPQYAVFDTSFHAKMPAAARHYAIPQALAAKHGFHKYGFHGLSYQYVSSRAAELLGRPIESLKLIICHLGTGGSSVVAMKEGKSFDTSMGFSPLPGLVMSTRCGDIDPEIVLELVRQGYSPTEVSGILNNQSGLLGVSGFSSNLPEIIEESEKGNSNCKLAYEIYAHRLMMYLGSYFWLLNGTDAIIFTDDVGITSWKLREKVLRDVENCGIQMDLKANRSASSEKTTRISFPDSKIQVWTIPTDEEVEIFKEVLAQIETN